jgi:hypothetical protein
MRQSRPVQSNTFLNQKIPRLSKPKALIHFSIHILVSIVTFIPSSGGMGSSQNALVVRSQNIRLDGASNSLQCLVRFTFGIVVFHIIQRGKGSLNGDVEALVTGVVEGFAGGSGDDVGLAVLDDCALDRFLFFGKQTSM